jgi:predicted esterase
VYIPENYNSAVPTGVLVFISAGNSGRIPNAWKELMGQYNLIWVGANKSGNKIATSLRVAYAVLAVALVNKNYKVDANRIYLSGFSGGGRVSSMVASEYAHIFRGAIFNSGANIWGESKPKRYDDMKKNHYVFITGSNDFNLQDTKKVYNAYRKADLQNTKLIVIPMMSHRIPRKSYFEEAINFLDSRKID